MAATKNLSLVVLAGAVGYLIYRRSLTAQETAFATIAAPVPSPGTSGLGAMPRARLSSQGGTNMLAGLPGVWIPEESGWDKPVVSGLGDLGRGFHRPSWHSVVSAAQTMATGAIPFIGPTLVMKHREGQVLKVAKTMATGAIPIIGPTLVMRARKASQASGGPAAVPPPAPAPDTTTADQTTVYQDANGNVITQDQYNQLTAQQTQTQTQQVQSPALNAQSASVTNATPISYSDSGTLYTSQGATNIAPTATATDSGSGGGAEPTGRFDGQASGGTDVSTPNVAAQPASGGGGKMALFLAAAGAGAFFLLKK